MATTNKMYVPTHPGQLGALKLDTFHIPPEDGRSAYMAANVQAALFSKNTFPIIGGGSPYSASEWAITTGGTGDAQAVATTPGGGLLITYASDDNFDTTLDSVWGFTPATGKVLSARYRVQVSDADGLGIKLGFTTGGSAAALPFGTNYTDVIAFSKPIASAAMVGTVRGNSGTAANTGTLVTLSDATEIDIGFACMPHATAPWGFWYVNAATGLTVTPFTANQLTQLTAILTTPPTMYHTLHGTGVTATNPTMTVTSCYAQVDN